jgi:hypothetical protein
MIFRRKSFRRGIVAVSFLIASLQIVHAAPPSEFYNSAAVLQWINTYRSKPDPIRAASAIRQLSGFGDLRNQESAGVYVGFAAGVLAANPAKAEVLVGKMLPLPPEDLWLVVRAVAYSGLPNWRAILTNIAPRVPARAAMLQKYLAGQLPTLAQYRMEKPQPSWLDRTEDAVMFLKKPKPKDIALEPSSELLDTFWGLYYANGDRGSLQRIVSLLPWSKNRDEVEKLTLGGVAKYTLAQNATRDPALLATLKAMRASEPEAVRPVLDEVIAAADDVDVSHVRSELLASLDELKTKGSASKRSATLWGQVGQGAVAAGCIAAAVAGQVQFGIPCVVGGAVSTGALNIWSSQN